MNPRLESRHFALTSEARAKMVRLYLEYKVSIATLSARFGVSTDTVRTVLDAAGVRKTRGNTVQV